MIKLKFIAASAAALAFMASTAMADKVLRIQSVLPNTADEVVMLNEFGRGLFLGGAWLSLEAVLKCLSRLFCG